MNDEDIFRDPGEVPVLDWIDKDLQPRSRESC
jgi:hypothetical protein